MNDNRLLWGALVVTIALIGVAAFGHVGQDREIATLTRQVTELQGAIDDLRTLSTSGPSEARLARMKASRDARRRHGSDAEAAQALFLPSMKVKDFAVTHGVALEVRGELDVVLEENTERIRAIVKSAQSGEISLRVLGDKLTVELSARDAKIIALFGPDVGAKFQRRTEEHRAAGAD